LTANILSRNDPKRIKCGKNEAKEKIKKKKKEKGEEKETKVNG
jgi:hypothetical protein